MKSSALKLISDTLLLLASFIILSLVSRYLLFPTTDYLMINGIFFILLLPGWYLSLFFLNPNDSVFYRSFLAALISFIIYGLVLFFCYLAKFSFSHFYILYLVSITASLGFSFKQYKDYSFKNQFRSLTPLKLLFAAATFAFIMLCYKHPPSSDMDYFLFSSLDYLKNQSFDVTLLGPLQYNVHESVPRWNAHFYHIFFSFLSDLSNFDMVSIIYYLAPVPLGLLMFGSLYYFVKSLTGPDSHYALIVLALICPLTLFYSFYPDQTPFDFSFRILNSPALDKDFAQFFIVPALAFLSISYIQKNENKYLTLLYLSIPMALYFHPLIGIYYTITLLILAVGLLSQQRKQNFINLIPFIVIVVGFFFTFKSQGSHHEFIDRLIQLSLDFKEDVFHAVHYASVGRDTPTISWLDGTMILKPELVWITNNLIRSASIATLIWCLFLGYRRFVNKTTVSTHEKESFKVQLGFIIILLLITALAPIVLSFKPYLYRGIERLHWVFLGFFAFYFVATTIITALNKRLTPSKNWVMNAFVLLITLHLVDQSHAFYHRQPAFSEKIPGIDSIATSPAIQSFKMVHTPTWFRFNQKVGLDKNSLFKKPAWLYQKDIVYFQPGHCYEFDLLSCYQLMRQSIYYHELYHQAFAFEKKGQFFLKEFRAFYDGYFSQITPRFLHWLKIKRATVLIANQDDFANNIGSKLPVNPLETRKLNSGTWNVYRIKDDKTQKR